MQSPSRAELFNLLANQAQNCSLCPGMAERTAVLSTLNGSLHPLVLFVAEAPGRKGADRTRIPMTGDRSGVTFHHLLGVAGLRAEEIFITNAVLCSPRSESGANRPPKSYEIRNCTNFLRRTIEALDPPFVVTVGGAALKAVAHIERHELTLLDVGTAREWFGRFLAPVYHPSPQVLISRRSLTQQEEDWRMLSTELRNYSSRMTATASVVSPTSGERMT